MKQKKLPKQVTGSSSEKNLEMEIVPRKKKKQKVNVKS